MTSSPREPLLCETCGYNIEKLPTHAACPECGEPTMNSLPEFRTGSPYQQRPRLFTWWTTNWRVLRHPRTLFRKIRIERKTGTQLLLANLLIAAVFMVDPWVAVGIGDPARTFRNAPLPLWLLVYGATWVAEVLLGALVLLLLTRLEWYGMRFIAARRGWRLTPNAAWQVCCHASIGWLFVGLIPLLGMAWIYIFANWFGKSPSGMLHIPGITARPIPWMNVVNFGVLALGFLAGMLIFETLVYLGVRQCKFANPADLSPSSPITPPTTSRDHASTSNNSEPIAHPATERV